MATKASVRQKMKSLLRPVARPVLQRLRLPLDLIMPRFEQLERQVMEMQNQGTGSNHSGTIDNLVRTWLRLQNEVSHLTARMTDIAEKAVQSHVSVLDGRAQSIESRLHDVVATLESQRVAAEARSVAMEHRLAAAEHRQGEGQSGRAERVDETLRFLLDRVEFVRREMMFELRYGTTGERTGQPRDQMSRILSPDKVEAAQAARALRLNLGCGHIPEADYINVDMRDLPGVDVIAEAGGLPFEPGSVDEIYSAHLIEHFPQEEMTRRLLPHWRRVLRSGGRIRMITPDGEAMLAGLAQGTYPFEDFRDVLFGGQDYEGDFHYNLFTPDSLSRLLSGAGFTNVDIPTRGRRNGQCFEFELTAQVP